MTGRPQSLVAPQTKGIVVGPGGDSLSPVDDKVRTLHGIHRDEHGL
jgi:hypothetical protein